MPDQAKQPLDFTHLDRYTGGDRQLNKEVLGLFEAECHAMLARLEVLIGAEEVDGRPAPKAWHEVTHTLKGAARGVGAFGLADAAAEAEKIGPSQTTEALAVLERIKEKSAAVHRCIEDFLQG